MSRLTACLRVGAPIAVGALLVAGCGVTESTKAKAGTKGVTIAVTDDSCQPSPASAKAGALTFNVQNKNSGKVSEAELMQNGLILGEKENLTPGLSGKFTLRLQPGEYIVNCPNAKNDQTKFTVTGKASDAAQPSDASVQAAVTAYDKYVNNQAKTLVARSAPFIAAVKAGDVAKAKTLFAPARTYYEMIEPVAESFGNLDPEIDARVNDVANPKQWTGFHRIEKALWQDNSLAGMGPMADKLQTDILKLQTLTKTAKFQPAQIANGSVSLLDEVAKSKITGEEDRYSHTDLWDFDANLAGAREAFQVLQPVLQKKDPKLVTTISTQFNTVAAALATYRKGDAYVDYSTVGTADRRHLTTIVTALSESLSKVAGEIV
ncbi:MAG TPA: iron uptake system protein EfeO [Mycobacteriales bacterium]|jgi:iron uptake system component EfeO|nr:iron uptake system protein EfeO [Mycobacteriales bacterium]